MNIPIFIREALYTNGGDNYMAVFLRGYYRELLSKADEHKRVVQTNRDETIGNAVAQFGKQRLNG